MAEGFDDENRLLSNDQDDYDDDIQIDEFSNEMPVVNEGEQAEMSKRDWITKSSL